MWKYIKSYWFIALLAVLFMVGDVMAELLQPEIMRGIVDDGVLGMQNGGVSDLHLIWTLGLKMIILVILGGLSGALNNVFGHMTGQSIGNLMRKDCFRRIMKFSFTQVDQFGTGSLVTRTTNDVVQVEIYIATFLRGMVRMFMLTFGSMYFMFRMDYRFGLVMVGAFPLIAGCMIFCLSKANPLFSKLQAQLDRVNAVMQETVSGIRIIKACTREIYEKVRFGKANGALIKTQLQVLTIFSFMNPITNAIMYIAVIFILLVGDAGGGGATPGNIMAAITYSTQLLSGLLLLVMLFQNISRGIASWRRVKEILQSEPDLKDGVSEGKSDLRGQIEFRNVSFAYPGSSQNVLENINLTIQPGESIAIMGATGCGKTSLVNLISRFYDVTSGAVLVDGVDVREYNLKALRDKIAVALQKSELFSVSIQENIEWGRSNAPEEDMIHAAEIAQADEFIRSTPDGYHTMVAERGMSLSGGQKQRLSIARAVLKGSEILIFDDSTSALDLRTEADLYAALAQTDPESTKIMIAQRIASVRRADRIVVLEDGGIAACGTHEELLNTCKTYRDIYTSQMGEESEELG